MIKDFKGKTDKGIRNENQDNIALFKNDHNYLVAAIADGMGGHLGGTYASAITIKFIELLLKPINFGSLTEEEIKTRLFLIIDKIQEQLIKESKIKKLPSDMGTTLNLNIFVEDKVYTLNIGDTRATQYQKKKMIQISEDHNLSTLAMLNGNYDKFKNYNNYLTSSLGPKKTSKIDIFVTTLDSTGTWIITSDGIHDYWDDSKVIKVLKNKKRNLDDKIDDIFQIAKENETGDNISCLLIEYEF